MQWVAIRRQRDCRVFRLKRILLWVYTFSGALAGLGGVVMASQFRSGDPKYGLMYELYVIAAVVVGGTSLAGGEAKYLEP